MNKKTLCIILYLLTGFTLLTSITIINGSRIPANKPFYSTDQVWSKSFHINSEAISINIPIKPDIYGYSITNISDQDAVGPILYQDYLWNSPHNILKSKLLSGKNDLDRATNIWRFVYRYLYHFELPINLPNKDYNIMDLLLFYGYGWCSESSYILAMLYKYAGYDSGSWWTNGHVVSEVKIEEKWHMFDANVGIYFHPKGKKVPYSFSSIGRDISKLHYYEYLADEFFYEKKTPSYRDRIACYSEYGDYFITTRDNYFEKTENKYKTKNKEFRYELMLGEKICFFNFNWREFLPSIGTNEPPRFISMG